MKKEILLTIIYLAGILLLLISGLIELNVLSYIALIIALVGFLYCIWKANIKNERKY